MAKVFLRYGQCVLQHMGACLTWTAGCSELIFNPLVRWWRLGPINKQLRIFVWSDAPVHYKLSMMACTCALLSSMGT